MQNRQVESFISTVEGLPEVVTEFREDLWSLLVDRVTVFGKNDLRFTLADGTEIKA